MENNSSNTSCILVDHQSVICSNVQYNIFEEPLNVQHNLFWIYLIGYICVVLFAGMMSGLTLAIFSLDLTSLKVLQIAGSDKDKKYASRIMPLAARQYLVLVSLVLANSLAVEAMPLLLDRISTPIIAIIVSTTGVLIFGEILPQAICGRYGMVIGYYFSWLVWAIIAILFVIAWPLSKVLDCVLGSNRGTFYRRAELKALVDIHGPQTEQQQKKKQKKRKAKSLTLPNEKMQENQESLVDEAHHIAAEHLSVDEVLIIRGALDLASKKAEDAMIKLADVYMLSMDDVLDANKLQELITVDPHRSTKVKDFVQRSRYFYPPYFIQNETPLYVLLKTFEKGQSTHISFVYELKENGSQVIVGIITLEDIIEELLCEEILDETDVIRDINQRIQLARAGTLRSLSIAGPAKKASTFSTGFDFVMSRKRSNRHKSVAQLTPVAEYNGSSEC